MNTTNEIVEQLESAKKEIEQFIHELNQKDTNAEERLEKIKEEFRSQIREMKDSLDQRDLITEEVAKTLRVKLSSLEDQLQEPRRNALEDIELFMTKIKNVLKEIGDRSAKDNVFSEALEKIHNQMQHYKMKFEVMRLKLALGKLEIKYASKEAQVQVMKKINTLSSFLRGSEHSASETMKRFRSSVNKIYSDISNLYS
jgi:DNA repair exonuclease SbcCD ATPase subunit